MLNIDGRTIELFPAARPGAPLVVLIAEGGEARAVLEAARSETERDFSLAAIAGFDWNGDLTPWPAEPLMKGQTAFGGRADAFLDWLADRALPRIEAELGEKPTYNALAGYSLAGLFALYALYRTDAFARAASASGSLWYPGFIEFAEGHAMARVPEGVYLSVGDRECRAKLAVMRPVEDNTRRMAELCRAAGIPATLEINPGGHFKNPEGRMGRGIARMLETE